MSSPTPTQQGAAPRGSVTLIGGGPGAWDLITVRGMRALQAADVILTDHLGPAAELDRLCDVTTKEVLDVAKIPYRRQTAQEEINRLLVAHARAGKHVARLKGGDPFVFGRGSEELRACLDAGVACSVVPGVTSAIAVPAAIGVPLSERGVVHSFTVVSGHLPPGHPKSLVDWEALAAVGGSICVIMGVKHVAAICRALIDGGLDPATPSCAVHDGTLGSQRAVSCRLDELAGTMADTGITAPAVFVVGEVAGQAWR